MGLEYLSVVGESVAYYNPLDDLIYLNKIFFEFIKEFGVPLITLMIIVWAGLMFAFVGLIIKKSLRSY